MTPTSTPISWNRTLHFLACIILCVPIVCHGYMEPTSVYTDVHSSSTVQATNPCSASRDCINSLSYSDCKAEGMCKFSCANRKVDLKPEELTRTNECQGSLTVSMVDTSANSSNGYLVANSTQVCTVLTTASANSSGTFSISFWILASCKTSPCIVLTVGSDDKPLLQIQVDTNNFLNIQNTITSASVNTSTYNHVVITKRFNDKIELFINNKPTTPLNLEIKDFLQNVQFTLGPSTGMGANDQLVILDARMYPGGLTKREITHLYTGTFPPVEDLSTCRCPLSHPDINSNNQFECMNGTNTVFRLVKHLEAITAVLDDENDTIWVSTASDDVILALDLGNSFQITSISITYKDSGAQPTSVKWKFAHRNKFQPVDENWYSCDVSSCTLKEQNIDNFDKFLKTVTKKIEITFEGRTTGPSFQNLLITDIVIKGRCDCAGTATTCNKPSKSSQYNCTCLEQSEGDNCRNCVDGFFRRPTVFGCQDTCDCVVPGLANVTKRCESVGGQCICKSNVGGNRCNTCKHLTYGLLSSKTLGCSRSSCVELGSASCNNVTGECNCYPNVSGSNCDACKDLHYNFASAIGCSGCLCETSGTTNAIKECNEITGQCPCKTNVAGRQCKTCKDEYYDLLNLDSNGCKSCECHELGTSNQGNVCDKITGQCLCRAADYFNRQCKPVVDVPVPLFGPKDGSTVITIAGHYLMGRRPEVEIGNTAQDIIKITDLQLQVRTKSSSSIGDQTLTLKWSGHLEAKTYNFAYKASPLIIKDQIVSSYRASIRGGCLLTFEGNNLNSVYQPYISISDRKQICRHVGVDGKKIQCPTPNITKDGNHSVDLVMDAIMHSSITTLIPMEAATINKFERDVQFSPPFEKSIIITGQNFGLDCNEDNYAVYIGSENITCVIILFTSTEIECEPPDKPSPDIRYYDIKVVIGTQETIVGQLDYLPLMFSLYFIAIIASVVIFLILLLILIIYCCCRYHRNKSRDTTSFANNRFSTTPNGATSVTDIQLVTKDEDPIVPAFNPTFKPIDMDKEKDPDEVVNQEYFLHRVEESIRANVQAVIVGERTFEKGTMCIATGAQSRLIDGKFTSKSKIQRNKKITIKMVKNAIPGKGVLSPMYTAALRECLRLKPHHDDNILCILGIGLDKNRFYIIYPYMELKTLKHYISDSDTNFVLRQLLEMCLQVSNGMEYLAGCDFVHKDLAARNCMVDSLQCVKISDCAFSWDIFPNEYMYDDDRDRYLPIRWMAPESLKTGFYDSKSDVWAFGVLMWEVLTRGMQPFQEIADVELKSYIMDGYRLGKPQMITDDQYELLNSCWQDDSDYRPSFLKIQREIGSSLVSRLSDNQDLYINTENLDMDNMYVNQKDLHRPSRPPR